MFSFFKKKMREPEAPQHVGANKDFVPFQQTKVEDDVASFEVPDFSEDDMNFDLGLGEFLSEKQPEMPMPKGLPVDTPPAPNMAPANHVEEPVQDQETPPTPEVSEPPISDSENVFEEEAPKLETQDEANVNWAADAAEEESPDEDLPKFNVSPQVSLSDMDSAPEQKKATPRRETKKAVSSSPQPQPKKVQTSEEGLFLTKQAYTKMIILAEDTTRKAGTAEQTKSDFLSLSDNKDLTVDALIKNMKSVRDSVMLADAKLFGR